MLIYLFSSSCSILICSLCVPSFAIIAWVLVACLGCSPVVTFFQCVALDATLVLSFPTRFSSYDHQ